VSIRLHRLSSQFGRVSPMRTHSRKTFTGEVRAQSSFRYVAALVRSLECAGDLFFSFNPTFEAVVLPCRQVLPLPSEPLGD
jgi:hypothetical protein